jgi:putative ABC transport system ATP-binding protein
MTTIAAQGVSKRYGDGRQAVAALTDVTLTVDDGEFVAVMGPSGSGKSTLLNLIAGIDTATEGRVVVGGRDLGLLTEDARSDLRLQRIGLVFQSFNLFPMLTALENVSLPLDFLRVGPRASRRAAAVMLERVGVSAAAQARRQAELSGGEQQRVALARALVTRPELLLADEPTGNLDSATGLTILRLLQDLDREQQLTIVLVTHSETVAGAADRIVTLRDGRIVGETKGRRGRERELTGARPHRSTSVDFA